MISFTFKLCRNPGCLFQSSVRFSSATQSCLTLCDPMDCSTPGSHVRHQFPESVQTHVHWVSDAIQPSHPLSSPSPPAFSLSQHQGVFQWVSSLHQVAKVLEFQLSISPSNEYSGLISFRMDWLDLLAVQGALKSLLQHHSSKAWIRCSACFLVQLSHPHMTTGKTIALTRRTFVGPSEQDPVFLTVSLFHQEASINLLSLSLRGQTEWKPRSQKMNQTDRMDHSLV